jgi:papain like cysteine protease AvrRpt2
MRSPIFGSLIVAAGIALLAGCPPTPDTCSPGETQECACGAGEIGVQSCSSDGRGWGACTECGVRSGYDAGPGVDAGPNPGPTSCGNLPISPTRIQLPLTPIAQQCAEWCWAASISMIANYYGATVQECTLATAATGNSVDCCNYAACSISACDQGEGGNAVDTFFPELGIHGSDYPCALPERELAAEIGAGRPVMIGFQGPFSGHAAVVSGYTPGNPATYTLNDPYYGVFEMTYQELLAGGVQIGETPWAESWAQLSPKTAVCVPDPSYCQGI